ncbi:MAG: aldo/keto reductase [Oscillospiraceae bacterium]|nr:aldo/keto reductase [Oscillospiraceae bacterium]
MEKTITSRLGFGLMRLPLLEGGEIDMPQVCKMVDTALEAGVNYFDTAYGYHDGKSETAIREALVKRYDHSKYFLATKLPFWKMECEEDVAKLFNEQLEKTGTDFFDYYLLHCLNKENFEKAKNFKAIEYCEQMKAEGKIKKFGFSFHDDAETLEKIFKHYDKWEFVQLQLNYYDLDKEDYQKQLALANQYNIPVIVMEPIRGGFLARTVPNGKAAVDAAYGENKLAALALSYVDSLPGVFLTLSGMSNMEQMLDNIETYKAPIPMDDKAKQVISTVLTEIKNFQAVDCTKCEYCLPCPAGLDIPRLFEVWSNYEVFKSEWNAKEALKKHTAQPADCIGCRACESKCPQHIRISEEMAVWAGKIAQFK